MRNINWKNLLQNLSPLGFSIFHLGLLFTIYHLLVLGSFIHLVDIYHFKQWDANWYAGIAETGYHFSDDRQSNTAFFPLFPYIWKTLWKITGAGVEGICIYNTMMFLLGMTILKKAFHFSWMYFLVFLSIPSNMFMYVPYSEATFFFFSSFILAGLKMNKQSMIIIGLFFASLTRPSAVYFIPAIIGMELFTFIDWKTFARNTIVFSIIPILAMLLTFLFQYWATGTWMSFLKAHDIGWIRTWQWPQFPLTTWGGFKNLWLDGLALFFGILATVILVVFILRKLRKSQVVFPSKAESFSLIYIMMAMITILLFNSKDPGGGTTIAAINRHLMATPYFILVLYFLSCELKLDLKAYIIYLAISLLTLSLINLNGAGYNEYKFNDKLFYAFLMFGHTILYSLISSRYNGRFLLVVYLINVCIQVIILQQFAQGKWIS